MTRRQLATAAAVVLLALGLRLHYLASVVVVNPFGGDAFDYLRYSMNLADGYFGLGAEPDAYRSPGYPVLVMLARTTGTYWVTWLGACQAVLGAATVAALIAFVRQWLPAWAALLAGALLAIWPHHITMTVEVLSEVLFGFLLMVALLLIAQRRAVLAGTAFAAAALVNPVSLLLPVALAPVVRKQMAVSALLVPALLLPAAWALRPVDAGPNRAAINFVQGSWPLYHRAYVSRNAHPVPARIIAAVDEEAALLQSNPAEGLAAISERIAANPAAHAKWYAKKPYLLWDWDIRISDAGGPYVHKVIGSPFDTGMLRGLLVTTKHATPLLFALAVLGALVGLMRGPPHLRAAAVAFAYFTAVHFVLQAEPRYSIPYRAIQFALVATAITWALSRLRSSSQGPIPYREPPSAQRTALR